MAFPSKASAAVLRSPSVSSKLPYEKTVFSPFSMVMDIPLPLSTGSIKEKSEFSSMPFSTASVTAKQASSKSSKSLKPKPTLLTNDSHIKAMHKSPINSAERAGDTIISMFDQNRRLLIVMPHTAFNFYYITGALNIYKLYINFFGFRKISAWQPPPRPNLK